MSLDRMQQPLCPRGLRTFLRLRGKCSQVYRQRDQSGNVNEAHQTLVYTSNDNFVVQLFTDLNERKNWQKTCTVMARSH